MDRPINEEITSINAIYGDGSLVTDPAEEGTYLLQLPSLPGAFFKLHIPDTYPDEPPEIIGTVTLGDNVKAGKGKDIVQLIQDALCRVYHPGACCIFDLVEECGSALVSFESDADVPQTRKMAKEQGNDLCYDTPTITQVQPEAKAPPSWVLSDPVTEKKSIFVARAAHVISPAQARYYLDHLLATDKKVARATHNVNAWRIKTDSGRPTKEISATAHKAVISFQDCDDDGETAAGGRLLHLLQVMDVWNVMVVVTRWYGGVHLGPDRFRIMGAVAREAVVRAGFVGAGASGGSQNGEQAIDRGSRSKKRS